MLRAKWGKAKKESKKEKKREKKRRKKEKKREKKERKKEKKSAVQKDREQYERDMWLASHGIMQEDVEIVIVDD